jgi:hypothetical protein
VWHVWGEEKSYRVLVGKPKGRRLLGRHRHRLGGDIKIVLKGAG